MATNNAVNVGLAGATGTGNFVGANTPTLITPVLGVATGTSITFNPTTGGIVGTPTNNNASTGIVGELLQSIVTSAAPVSLVTATAKTVTSLSLTAGDWDIFGMVGTSVGAGTTVSTLAGSISIVNNARGAEDQETLEYPTGIANNIPSLVVPTTRLSLSATTTVYLIAIAVFAVNNASAYGRITARRAR